MRWKLPKMFGLLLVALPAVAVAEEPEKPQQNWIVAPIVMSSPALGDGGGLSGFYFFDMDKENPATPPSQIFGTAVYTSNESFFAVIVPSLYMQNDTRRFEMPIAYGDIKNDFDDVLTGTEVDFDTEFFALNPVFRWRVWEEIFLGVQASVTDLKYTANDAFTADFLRRVGAEDTTLYGVGAVATRDTRDNQLFPFRGSYAEANFVGYPDLLDNDSIYSQLKVEYKTFLELRPEQILGLRVYGQFAFGDTAYFGEAQLGRFSDLRGYVPGENTADNLITAQAEYRHLLWGRLGFVVFAGLANLYDDKWYDVDSGEYFESYGFGLRWRLLKEQRVNFRVDFAWGEDDDAYYVSLREAF